MASVRCESPKALPPNERRAPPHHPPGRMPAPSHAASILHEPTALNKIEDKIEGEREPANTSGRVRTFLWKLAGPVVAGSVIGLAVVLLVRALSRYQWAAVVNALASLDPGEFVRAGLFALASYSVLTGFDALGLRYAGRALPYRKAALASFVALSIGHTLGFSALSSGAVRFRFYRAWGLVASEIARVILFCGSTVLLGYAAVGGIALTAGSSWLSQEFAIGRPTVMLLGAVALAAPTGYLAAVLWGVPLRLGRFVLEPPPLRLALSQLLLGSLDVILVAAVLHQTLGGAAQHSYATILVVYLMGSIAGMLAHAPGGLGVLEAVTLALLPGPATIAGLVAFRTIYYLLPLTVGGTLFAVIEMARRRRT
jgi:glycosyltransferase 2 family protein